MNDEPILYECMCGNDPVCVAYKYVNKRISVETVFMRGTENAPPVINPDHWFEMHKLCLVHYQNIVR